MSTQVWNSLEIAKLIVGVLAPIAVVVIGWFINRSLKEFEHRQWVNQKLVEKRIALYDQIAPDINTLYCFYRWVGNWKEITPREVIQAKRRLDKIVNIYRAVLGEEFFERYKDFIGKLFVTWREPGEDAGIRAEIIGPNGNRKTDAAYAWDPVWDSLFVTLQTPVTYQELEQVYLGLVSEFRHLLHVPVRG